MRKVLVSLFMICTLFITSCSIGAGSGVGVSAGAGSAKIDHNDEINKEILDSVKILDDKVLDSIKNNDADKILEISSEAFKKESGKLNEWLANANESEKNRVFDYQDRYYCNVDKVGKFNLNVNTLKDDPFYITVEAASKDIFVSLIKSTSNKDDSLLSLIYIKEQGEWKLRTLTIDNYSYGGMNAIDLYEKAKSLDTQGYKVPASLYSVLSNKLLHPAPFIKYKKESEITDYHKKLLENIKNDYTFPQKLKNANNVEIYGLDVKYVIDKGIVPFIKYTTDIEWSNKKEIEKEANDMNNEVTSLYPGMKETFKFILYEAYSEPPVDAKKTYDCYRTGVEEK